MANTRKKAKEDTAPDVLEVHQMAACVDDDVSEELLALAVSTRYLQPEKHAKSGFALAAVDENAVDEYGERRRAERIPRSAEERFKSWWNDSPAGRKRIRSARCVREMLNLQAGRELNYSSALVDRNVETILIS